MNEMDEVFEYEDTGFEIQDEEGNKILSGWIEWGVTVDDIYYNHPMAGQCTESPLQGWADPPGASTGHAEVAAVLNAINDNDMFIENHVGRDCVIWEFNGEKLTMN
jgi:hypothetical protein